VAAQQYYNYSNGCFCKRATGICYMTRTYKNIFAFSERYDQIIWPARQNE